MTWSPAKRYITVPAGTPGAVRCFDGDKVFFILEVPAA